MANLSENTTNLQEILEILQTKVLLGLITFRIDGTSYNAFEGLTWAQWCNSSANTKGYYVGSDNSVYDSSGDFYVVNVGEAGISSNHPIEPAAYFTLSIDG